MGRIFFRQLLLIFILWISHFPQLAGQNLVLKQTSPSGIYKKDQQIKVFLYSPDHVSDSISIVIRKNFTEQLLRTKVKFVRDTVSILEEYFNEPATLIFEASVKNETVSIGAIIEPEEYQPATKRPGNIDKFWKAEKKALRAIPVTVKKTALEGIEKGYSCTDIEISCTGPKPVRGYFAKPENAATKSLPAVLYVHAAGVSGFWCRSEPGNAMKYAKMGRGALCFDLNAHGMLNGQPDAYYKALEIGELKDYAQIGLESMKDCYFRGMYLRLIRTLDFLASQPEWDGRRILVIGESQGGGQSLVAAGLDRRVGAVVATVPAMCDWGATLVGRKGCWPYPFSTKFNREKMLSVLPYFDAAHILKGSKATLVVEIGLIDLTCPSSAIYAAINQSKGKKIILNVPYRAHQMTQESYRDSWNKSVYNTKEGFIRNYLK